MSPELPAFEVPERVLFGVEKALPDESSVTWVPGESFELSALSRVPRFPTSIGDADTRSLTIEAARNERRSAQLAVATTEPIEDLHVESTVFDGPDGHTISGDAVEVRYVGYVPVETTHDLLGEYHPIHEIENGSISGDRSPDVVGDPLLERETIDVPSHRAQAVWLTFDVPSDAPAGTYEGELAVVADGDEEATYEVELSVRDVALPDPSDAEFHLDVWMHPDAVATEHGVERWSAEHWSLLEAYFADLAATSQRAIAAPIVHEPWQRRWLDGSWRPQTETGFSSLVDWHYDGEWRFDFDRFDRFVETALDNGVGPTISAYSMLVFRGPQRLSYYDSTGEFVVDTVDTDDDRWHEAWTAFLSAFGDHLKEKGWLEQTFLAFDERPSELMEAALDVVEAAAYDFEDRIQVAGSMEVEAFTDDLSVHYRHLPLDEDLLADRHDSGQTTTFYTTTAVGHPSTMCYSPAVEARMLPWIAAANDVDGVLNWSYNSWPSNVFENPIFRYPQGGEYLVYPGESGPISSIRWELLREGIGEYELAKMAGEGDRDEPLQVGSRHPDGRDKDVEDILVARRALFDALE